MIQSTLVMDDEVRAALEQRRPIVAFETTILSFGLPEPLNLQVARECEEAARTAGVTPATLAIMNGAVRAGLDDEAIRFFCTKDADIKKVNLQNFGAAVALKWCGALTVAASMKACTMAGLQVFATGGIGGVHRGFSETLDISADIAALAALPVAVVCAGAKSILDVSATLEALETAGVPVIGYRTTTFPLFHAALSSHTLELHTDRLEELALLVKTHLSLCSTGVLVVTPVPEEAAIPLDQLNLWMHTALDEARAANVRGKQVTPFLLKSLETLSGGRTLRANHALIVNNANVAAGLASALAIE